MTLHMGDAYVSHLKGLSAYKSMLVPSTSKHITITHAMHIAREYTVQNLWLVKAQ